MTEPVRVSEAPPSSLDYDELFETMVSDACTELFSGCGVELAYEGTTTDVDQAYTYAGVLGFGAVGIKGNASLFFDPVLLRASHPVRGSVPSGDEEVEALRDWTSELANQFVGRLKNKLVRYGVEVNLGIPTAVSGFQFRLTQPGADTRRFQFRWEGSVMTIALSVKLGSEIVLHERADADAAASEGDMILF